VDITIDGARFYVVEVGQGAPWGRCMVAQGSTTARRGPYLDSPVGSV